MSDYADGAEAMRAAILARFNKMQGDWIDLRAGYDSRKEWNHSRDATREIEGYRTAIGVVRGIALEDPTVPSPAIDYGLPYGQPLTGRPGIYTGRKDAEGGDK
jgi:hypothetical protein